MLIKIFNGFVKITAYPVQKLIFRTKVYYQNKSVQSRRIKDAAIIASNHTSVFDYAVYLFVFFTRTLRVQMAEVLFDKKPLGIFLKMLGGIYVNRDARDFSFMYKSEEVLKKGYPVETEILEKHGARGNMRSFYLRDPDGNLVEISSYGVS